MLRITCINANTKEGGLVRSAYMTKVLYNLSEDQRDKIDFHFKANSSYYNEFYIGGFGDYMAHCFSSNETPTQTIEKLKSFLTDRNKRHLL